MTRLGRGADAAGSRGKSAMTMLDRMRRHRGWLKWSLALVVLAFVFFYIPDFLQTQDAAAPNAVVARVGDQEITAAAFRRAYLTQLQSYQRAYGGSINEQLLKQMGIEKQILPGIDRPDAAGVEIGRDGSGHSRVEAAEFSGQHTLTESSIGRP